MRIASLNFSKTTTFLPDINVWLALAFESHVHHGRARTWFEGTSNDGCSFCRLTQQRFPRLATNPKAFDTEAVTMSEAGRMYDACLALPRASPEFGTSGKVVSKARSCKMTRTSAGQPLPRGVH